MAHFGVEFGGNISITAISHEVDGFFKVFFADNTRVVGTSDKENRSGGIFHLPAIRIVSAFHKAEEDNKSVEREGKAVAFISVISRDHGRVADNPGVRASIVSSFGIAILLGEFGGTFVVTAESEVINKLAAVFFATESFHELCDSDSRTGARIITGRTANNEPVDILVVLFHIATDDERAHAVPEESERKTGKTLFDIFGNLVNVSDDAFDAVFAEITVTARFVEASAVTTMVMDDDDVALRCEIVHESVVTLAMLGHAVNELDDAFGTAIGNIADVVRRNVFWVAVWDAEADAEIEPVMVAFDSEFLFGEGGSLIG